MLFSSTKFADKIGTGLLLYLCPLLNTSIYGYFKLFLLLCPVTLKQVTITPEVVSRTVNRAIIAELVKVYKESDLGKRLPAYDGRKSLYTAGGLPFVRKEFNVKLADEEDGINGPK